MMIDLAEHHTGEWITIGNDPVVGRKGCARMLL